MVTVECPGSKDFHTETVKGTLNPVYNVTFKYPVRDRDTVLTCASPSTDTPVQPPRYAAILTPTLPCSVVPCFETHTLVNNPSSMTLGPGFAGSWCVCVALISHPLPVTAEHDAIINTFLGRVKLRVDSFRGGPGTPTVRASAQ